MQIDWQTIETAPKTGERVLLSCDYYKAACIGAWNTPANSWLSVSLTQQVEQPSHWLPLPKTYHNG